jgi:hypothetical protein
MSTKSFTLPKDPLTPLDPNAEPTPATIRRLKQELYNNAQTVSSLLGGGLHGHLGLLMEEAAYTSISHGNTAYVFPDKPEAPNYSTGKTQVERDALKDAYGIDLDNYIKARDLNNVLKALIIKAILDLFIVMLKDPDFRYANVTPQEILSHLIEEYAQITADELKQNRKTLAAPWDPDTPILTVFTNGTGCRQFAIAGLDPISDKNYIAILLQTFEKSGVLEKATTDWEEKDEADQTVENFITHFKKADKFCRKRLITMKGTLTANTGILNGIIQPPTNPTPVPWGTYCWSHGICSHTSETCKYPATGHKKKATLTNVMGGRILMTRPPGLSC